MTPPATHRIWLFDLDNTLHNASAHVFPHINRAMTNYIMQLLTLPEDEADALRQHYWRRYGATMHGVVRHHGVRPAHFLAETHRFDALHRMLIFDRALQSMLRQLPGRKVVFSNGPSQYVQAVLRHMGIRRHFSDIYAVEHMRYRPKPSKQAFYQLFRDLRVQPQNCILVEDSTENLRTAKRLGLKTVLVGAGLRQPAYVDISLRSVLDLRRAARQLLT